LQPLTAALHFLICGSHYGLLPSQCISFSGDSGILQPPLRHKIATVAMKPDFSARVTGRRIDKPVKL
jgi:hypothetical protein